MKTLRKTVGAQTYFIVSELDPAYYNTMRDLAFSQVEDSHAKVFPTNSPHLDRCYQNFERYAEELILQAARVHPAPWEQALLALLEKIEDQGINWWLVGSAALAVRGMHISPRDIDLSVDDEGAHKLGEVLLDQVVQPVEATEDWICNWFGRAFLHTRLEWVGGVDERADTPEISDFGPTAANRRETIFWHGHLLQIPPLDLQLIVSERRGLTERVEEIKHFK
jgi:hypothetical protein